MHKITSGITRVEDLPFELKNLLGDKFAFAGGPFVDKLDRYLSRLKKGNSVYVEYPYVDKVYRSSFYSYFSTKHKQYNRDSIRFSVFEGAVTEEDFRGDSDLQNKYLGFVSLRPTLLNVIGRSYISPRAFDITKQFACCQVETEASINGVKLRNWSFPHSSQDGETISCAETTLLSLMEYFGNKYGDYRTVLPSQLIDTLASFSYQRQIPTHGLSARQLSYVLKQYGFGVRIYTTTFGDDLKRIFHYIVESGIPFIGTLMSAPNEEGHAVIVAGKCNQEVVRLNKVLGVLPRTKLEVFDSADFGHEYVFIDDNFPPYQLASFDQPTTYYNDPHWARMRFSAIVVPLYQKVYLEALEARTLMLELLDEMSHPFVGKAILRFFLTSSRSFKSYVAKSTEIQSTARDMILQCSMPKFVWVGEFSDEVTYSQRKTNGLIVLDATETNSVGTESLMFALYPDRLLINLEGKIDSKAVVSHPLNRFTNLRGV